MSVMPEGAPDPSAHEPAQADSVPPAVAPTAPPRAWQSRLLGICFAIFTFEIGLFLIVFPWLDNWNLNYFQGLIPALQDTWDDPYFRGAVTGLGFVNIFIALREVVRLFRRA
jgi:hypothetical protein